MTVYLATFSTLLAIISPLETLPVFLQLAGSRDDLERTRIARRACLYAVGLMFIFLIPAGAAADHATNAPPAPDEDIAFVPLAIPIMVGPGAIAAIVGMTSLVKQPEIEVLAFAAISSAIMDTMLITYIVLRAAKIVLAHLGPRWIDACTHGSLAFSFLSWKWG